MVVHKVLKTGEFYECIEKKCKFKEPIPQDKLKSPKHKDELKNNESKKA
jgi:hypothetical protein